MYRIMILVLLRAALGRNPLRLDTDNQEMIADIGFAVGTVFFILCLVGIVHALFAMHALGNVLGESIFGYASIVFVVYVAMQAIYFGISCWTYMRSIMSGAKSQTA